ncbi:FGGY-family carbohydrate kinase [Trueperella sp. LYQ143]|uniref:FGGY-family carbohydrate kinase n=1 Tax=unclassified Trueperella TaxID=2630174 RepID=UPI0039834C8F
MTIDKESAARAISEGQTSLGIEFGSTRIKAVLVNTANEILAVGTSDWESKQIDGVWTYTMEQIHGGLQACYRALCADVDERYGVPITSVGYLGFSALMHGYLAFDEAGSLLVPFRTYRNTMTGEASAELTKRFGITIPQRWSVAHLYQAVLNDEEHVSRLTSMTTLAGYAHRLLSGENILGIGDASGMFPIDDATRQYDERCVAIFDELVAHRGYPWKVTDLLPIIKCAGEDAGCLTAEGAAILDPSGVLQPGARMCPPEGDAGTGMVATNSVAVSTGNISVGTSVFAMVVLDKPLTSSHEELDPVTTPAGDPVAMVHCINGTGILDAIVKVFVNFAELIGTDKKKGELYDLLYEHALTGDPDGSQMVAFNYLAGEHVTKVDEGRPLMYCTSDSTISLANVMRVNMMSLFASLRIGMDILTEEEGVHIEHFLAHGGIFKTPIAPQRILAAALNRRIVVSEGAGEGGAWGIAMLANYLRPEYAGKMDLAQYLKETVFNDVEETVLEPDPADVAGYTTFIERYRAGLDVEASALRALPKE